MNAKISVGAALAIAVLTTTGTLAQTETYGTEAGWDILVNQAMGPGCLITKSNADGTQIQMGIDATGQKRGYMAIYTKLNVKVGADQKVSVLFDVDGQQFSGEAKGQQLGDFRGAFVWVNNPEFIYDMAKKKALTITPEGRDPILVNLEGTFAALEKLRACQDAQ
jgi:hypothetical protein